MWWCVLCLAVTMQAQRETPPDMQCKDKFLVQSVIAPPGSSTKEVSQDLVQILCGYFITNQFCVLIDF